MIKILKKRLGFATNSSSSHSVVFCPGHTFRDSSPGVDGQFGWSLWTAASKEAKRLYWAVQLRSNLQSLVHGQMPAAYYHEIVKALTGVDIPVDGYIDHQSVVALPRQHGGDVLDQRFYQQLVDAMLVDGVVIVGGNDNDSQQHEAAVRGFAFSLGIPVGAYMDPPMEVYSRYPAAKRRRLVSRYDEEHDQWVLFDQYTGEKTRLSFTQFHQEVAKDDRYPSLLLYNQAAPSGFPELVDVKITDYCARGCVWCYQGSGQRGKHADYYKVFKLAAVLKDLGVLEVAIGGGEPTSHPDFGRILECFRGNDIVPNFSTGTLAWMDDPELVEVVRKTVGGFAYTVRNVQEVEDFLIKVAALNQGKQQDVFRLKADYHDYSNNPDNPVVTVHIVMGTVTRQEFRAMLEKCAAYELGVVLLGYKHRGRGKGLKPIPYDWWLEEVKQITSRGCYGNVSIDTPLAKEHQQALKDEQVSSLRYDVVEGIRSMYVDLVRDELAPHSYVAPSGFQSLQYCNGPALERLRQQFRGREFNDPRNHAVHVEMERRERHFHNQGVKFLLNRFRHYRDTALMAQKKRKDD